MVNKRLIRNPEVLMNEVNVLRRLDHPNIIRLYESFEDKGYLYLVTEYALYHVVYAREVNSSTASTKLVALTKQRLALSSLKSLRPSNTYTSRRFATVT